MSKYLRLAEFGKELLNYKSIQTGLPLISLYSKEIINAHRCSLFIYDNEKDELWTTLADGIEKIIVDANSGLVGETLNIKQIIIENDPYSNPLFLPSVDYDTGFKTTSIITAPVFDSNGEVMGVFELMNKEDGFTQEDAKFMKFFAHYISGFLELVNVYQDKE